MYCDTKQDFCNEPSFDKKQFLKFKIEVKTLRIYLTCNVLESSSNGVHGVFPTGGTTTNTTSYY